MPMPTIADVRRGTDTSGRPLMSTDRFWRAWQALLRRPRVVPFADRITPVQGAWMALVGGGAVDSAGFHDLAACWDVRTWNLTDDEERILWEEAELLGIHFWKRARPAHMGGMDEHGHAVTLWDGPMDAGAAQQRLQAINGRDGLSRSGPDYMPRKTPPVLSYPAALIEGEDDMADAKTQRQLDRIEAAQKATLAAIEAATDAEVRRDLKDRERQSRRYRNLVAKIGGLADTLEGAARAAVLRVLAEEEDVTGADNPVPEKL